MNGYPEVIEISGVKYSIRTDYRDALACLNCIADTELSDYERAYGVIALLYEEAPANAREALALAVKYLRCGRETLPEGRADMDFEFDMHYIRSSFRSDYGIDLNRQRLHWWEFCELLQGLTDGCILNRVRDIRHFDLSGIKDSKTRQRIIKAQREVALPERLSSLEQDIIDEFEARLCCE